MDADSVTRDDVIRMVQSLMTLHVDLAGFYNTSGPRPAPNSQADIELHTFSRAESVETAYSQGEVLIEAAADNLAAFTLDTSSSNGKAPATVPDPEVVAKAERRHFTAEYKRRILQEADACRQPGEVGGYTTDQLDKRFGQVSHERPPV